MNSFIPYTTHPDSAYELPNGRKIDVFKGHNNRDEVTIASFGEEWNKFDSFTDEEIDFIGKNYFDILPPHLLNPNTYAMDVGCGTGRWSYYLANKVGRIECVDPSKAVFSAAQLLSNCNNIRITQTSADNLPFPDNTFDLVYSIGVLHHIPDTWEGVRQCLKKVKPGGYLYLYLYYNLDNRGLFHKLLFHSSNLMRKIISQMPGGVKRTVCDVLAFTIYVPFVLISKLATAIGLPSKAVDTIPLSWYRDKSIQVIRNDSLDRFGTPLERRFSKKEIQQQLQLLGCSEITFGDKAPFWRVVAKK